MSDIVEQLRKVGFYADDGAASSDGTVRPRTFVPDRTCLWAIDEIERLRVAESILRKLSPGDLKFIIGRTHPMLDEAELAYLAAVTEGEKP